MKSTQFVETLIEIAQKHPTLYVMGCFGAPLTDKAKDRYIEADAYNRRSYREDKIRAAKDTTFGFDCVGLIKSVLWGWSGDLQDIYGGADYALDICPDIGADTMISRCTDVSTGGWDHIRPGEAVWRSGHIGVYIGAGLAVECTPNWADGVQLTAVGNIGSKTGYPTRQWTKHGLLPYIEYVDEEPAPAPNPSPAPEEDDIYIVEEEDTLWDIAARFLDDGNRWPEIQRANNIENPDVIHKDDRIHIPGVRIHHVKEDEYLSLIAREKLGDAGRWPEIQQLNGIKDPDLIHAGDQLRLPK